MNLYENIVKLFVSNNWEINRLTSVYNMYILISLYIKYLYILIYTLAKIAIDTSLVDVYLIRPVVPIYYALQRSKRVIMLQ